MKTSKIKTWMKKMVRRKADHIEMTSQEVIETIVRSLIPLVGDSRIRSMVLWAQDAIVYQVLTSPGAMEDLATAFDNAELYDLGRCDIRVAQGRPQGMASTPVIKDKLDVTFNEERDAEVHGYLSCMVSIVKGTGSMERESYTLESSAAKRIYHVGRGKMVHRRDIQGRVIHRANDIVIRDDEPDAALSERNRHVSSNQADIITVNGKFYIKAMPGGCSNLDGSATKIFRGAKTLEIGDTFTRHRLHDGDVIELGTKVCLEVSIEASDGQSD